MMWFGYEVATDRRPTFPWRTLTEPFRMTYQVLAFSPSVNTAVMIGLGHMSKCCSKFVCAIIPNVNQLLCSKFVCTIIPTVNQLLCSKFVSTNIPTVKDYLPNCLGLE